LSTADIHTQQVHTISFEKKFFEEVIFIL
jgi:hypothetical protein